MLLARLAVDHQWKKQGIGKALLRDALLRILQASEIAGIRDFVVHAKGEDARRFYQHFDFIPSPTDPRNHHNFNSKALLSRGYSSFCLLFFPVSRSDNA